MDFLYILLLFFLLLGAYLAWREKKAIPTYAEILFMIRQGGFSKSETHEIANGKILMCVILNKHIEIGYATKKSQDSHHHVALYITFTKKKGKVYMAFMGNDLSTVGQNGHIRGPRHMTMQEYSLATTILGEVRGAMRESAKVQ